MTSIVLLEPTAPPNVFVALHAALLTLFIIVFATAWFVSMWRSR